MASVAYLNDTTRLSMTFRNWEGELSTPTGTKCQIYDATRTKVGEPVDATEASPGVVFIPWCPRVEDGIKEGEYWFEFYGVLDGEPVSRKSLVTVTFG